MASENELVIPGYFENLSRISDFIHHAARQTGLDDRAVYAIQMAVDEACTNIIEHAYGGEGKGAIRLFYQIYSDGLQVTIFDQGAPFDPTQVPELDTQAPLNERQPGGMGLFFIRQLVDEAEFTFNTVHGNQLRLFKSRVSTP